jgi:hypothetical protein
MGIKQTTGKSVVKLNYKTPISVDQRLDLINQTQIKLNVGGVIFYTTHETIKKSYFESLFKKLDIDHKDEFFIDRSFQDFELIIEILRQSCLITYSGNEAIIKTQKGLRNLIIDKEIFLEDLKFYFGKDFSKVEKAFNLTGLSEYRECNLIDKYELVKPIKDQKLEYMYYIAKDIKELLTLNSRKGFFMEADGALIINLSVKTTLERMEIRPFVFDKEYYNHTECVGVFIESSLDRSNWKYVAKVKFSPANEWVTNLYLHASTMKYLKISTEKYNCPLSVSYIKLYN